MQWIGAIGVSDLSSVLTRRILGEEDRILHFQGVWYGAAQLRRDTGRAAAALRAAGVRAGDRVMLIDENSYPFIVSYLAMQLSGVCVVPVNPHMPLPELVKVAGRSGAIGVLAGSWLAESLTRESALCEAGLGFVAGISVTGEGIYDVVLHAMNAEHPPVAVRDSLDPAALPEPSSDTGAILLFTSGTTGTPKGVELTHSQVMATVRNVVGAHRLTADDVTYLFLPLFHINAEVIGLLSTLASGGRLVVEPKFSASRFWPVVREFGVTWVSAVPTVIGILTKAPVHAPAPRHLRFVRSASAPLPELHARRFEAMFQVPVIESYGMTEAASQICVNPVPPGLRKLGSAGKPYGIELRVVDECGEELAAGEVGEIAIRGESVIHRYASGAEPGKGFIDGWFMTGDIGYVDDDGYVFITGRSKEMINRAGQKIMPREVEEVIAREPAVKSVAVIGLPDELYGERIVAYVVAEPDARRHELSFKDRLSRLCAETISAYKCPSEYHLVDAIPLGPTGKIQRTRLREQALAVAAN